MKSSLKSLTALLLVGIFASTSVLAAPPDHRYDRRPTTQRHAPPPPPRRAPPPRHHYTPPPPPPVQASHRHYDRPWRVGRSLPRTVTYYEVATPQRYKLAPPPRGHRYVRVGNDILLLAISTGIIANAIYDIAR